MTLSPSGLQNAIKERRAEPRRGVLVRASRMRGKLTCPGPSCVARRPLARGRRARVREIHSGNHRSSRRKPLLRRRFPLRLRERARATLPPTPRAKAAGGAARARPWNATARSTARVVFGRHRPLPVNAGTGAAVSEIGQSPPHALSSIRTSEIAAAAAGRPRRRGRAVTDITAGGGGARREDLNAREVHRRSEANTSASAPPLRSAGCEASANVPAITDRSDSTIDGAGGGMERQLDCAGALGRAGAALGQMNAIDHLRHRSPPPPPPPPPPRRRRGWRRQSEPGVFLSCSREGLPWRRWRPNRRGRQGCAGRAKVMEARAVLTRSPALTRRVACVAQSDREGSARRLFAHGDRATASL